MEMIRKSASTVVRAIGDGQVEAIVSAATIDRDGEIILPSAYAARLDVYRRNPIHIWMHDPKSLDNYLGRCTSIDVTADGLRAVFAYALDQPRGRQAYDLITMGALNCYSVGFAPIAWVRGSELDKLSPAQRAEVDGIDLSRVSRIYTDVELREISLVGIPSNTEAFIVGRGAKSMDIDTHDIAVRLRGLADAIEVCDMCDEGASDMIEHLNQALKILSSIAADYQASVETEVAEDAMEQEPVPPVVPAEIPAPMPIPAEPAPTPMDMMEGRGAKEGRVLSAANLAEFKGAHQDLMRAADRLGMILEACRPSSQRSADDIGEMSLEQLLSTLAASAE